MDWSHDETQVAIREMSGKLLRGAKDPFGALAEAGLLEVETLPQLCTLLIEVARAAPTTPVLETLVLGGPLRAAGLVSGSDTGTAGLLEPASRDPLRATCRADGRRLHGTKICVPNVDRATHMVVPTVDGLYAAALAECAVERQIGTNGQALGTVTLDGATAIPLGDREALAVYLQRVDVGIAAYLLGLAQEALALTAAYVSDREQFGRKIGTFQAVSQRAADAWIETQAMEVTLWQAAWRLDAGLPCEREVAIARYTASEGAHRVLATAQHLHGGMGFDKDYALHRYFLAVKAWEFVGGGASAQLERLGGALARG